MTQRERVVEALRKGWQVVGPEILGQTGADIPREDVFDVACDELTVHGKLSSEDFEWFMGLDTKTQNEIAREAFPHAVYGY